MPRTKTNSHTKLNRQANVIDSKPKKRKLNIERSDTEQLAKDLKLRPKTKAFVDTLLANPKISQTQAYLDTHKTESRKVARVEASKLMAKPSVRIYSSNAVAKAKKRIVTLVESENESIALRASQDVVDREYGKATLKQETTNRTVEVKLDLTGVRIGAHYLPTNVV